MSHADTGGHASDQAISVGQASAGTSPFRQILGNGHRHVAERQYDSGAMNEEAYQHQHGSQSQTSQLETYSGSEGLDSDSGDRSAPAQPRRTVCNQQISV